MGDNEDFDILILGHLVDGETSLSESVRFIVLL